MTASHLKQLSDVVLSNASSSSSSSIPPGVASADQANQQMNSLKSMAENAILNLTPSQQSSLSQSTSGGVPGFTSATNGGNDLTIANLLATLQQQPGGLSGRSDLTDPATVAALASLLAQQNKGSNINLPAALSALQQQQNFQVRQFYRDMTRNFSHNRVILGQVHFFP